MVFSILYHQWYKMLFKFEKNQIYGYQNNKIYFSLKAGRMNVLVLQQCAGFFILI